jgi:hypothetical protein
MECSLVKSSGRLQTRIVPSLAEFRRAAILLDVFPDGTRSEQSDRIEPLDFRAGMHGWGPSQVPQLIKARWRGALNAIISTAGAAVRAAMQADMVVCKLLRSSHYRSEISFGVACAHQ